MKSDSFPFKKPKSHNFHSLRASSPIWASKASRAQTRKRAAKPRGAGARASRACTFHDIPQMESLLTGYDFQFARNFFKA